VPSAFGVIIVGALRTGTVENIISDRADLKMTLRSHEEATRKLLIDGVGRAAHPVTETARTPTPTIM